MDKIQQGNTTGPKRTLMNFWSAVCIAVIVFGGGGILHAVGNDPLSQLRDGVEKLLSILKDEQLALPERQAERKKKVEEIADGLFDFREMASRTLADNWQQRTPAQKDRFENLFSRLVKQRYIGKIDSYSGQEVVFKKEIVKGKKAMIYSLVIDNNNEIPIDYKLIQKNDKWYVYDLKIENISLVANYRSSFYGIIKKDGYDALIQRLEEKVENFEVAK